MRGRRSSVEILTNSEDMCSWKNKVHDGDCRAVSELVNTDWEWELASVVSDNARLHFRTANTDMGVDIASVSVAQTVVTSVCDLC